MNIPGLPVHGMQRVRTQRVHSAVGALRRRLRARAAAAAAPPPARPGAALLHVVSTHIILDITLYCGGRESRLWLIIHSVTNRRSCLICVIFLRLFYSITISFT